MFRVLTYNYNDILYYIIIYTIIAGLSHVEIEIKKLRDIVNQIRNSPKLKENFENTAKELYVTNSTHLIQDVKTRWNSTYEMIERGLELRSVIDCTCKKEISLKSKFLSPPEWDVLIDIKKLLTPFAKATKLISGKKYPMANDVQNI